MASVTYTGTISPTYQEMVNNTTLTASLSRTSGTQPPEGSVLKSIQINISNIVVYTSMNPRLESYYGTFYLTNASGSQSSTATGASDAIFNFSGGTITFTVNSDRDAGKNVLNVRDTGFSITVEYEVRTASTGKLSSSQGMQGGSIYLDITAASSEFEHAVVWTRDSSHSVTYSVSAGSTRSTLNVPSSWPVGAATVTLYTYYNDNQVGSAVTYSWTVVVDGSVTYPTGGTITPALIQHSHIPSSWGLYVQGYSQCRLTLSGHAAGTSATIKDILLKCGSQQQSGTSNVFTTAALQETGSVAYSGVVTNSFDNSANSSGGNITVYAYESPKIVAIVAYRCYADGTPNDYGTYMSITATVTYSSVNSKNSLNTLQCQFAISGSSSWSSAVNLSSGVQKIVPGLSDTSAIYQVRVTAIDQVQNLAGTSTTKTQIVLTSECILFFMDGGLNVSVGTQGNRQNAVEINSAWDIYWGDVKLNDTVPPERGGTGQTSLAAARNAMGLGNTTGALPVANGGTGATSAAGARKNLGLGETSGALPVANGGTGATDASNARSNLGITAANIGAAASSHKHDASDINSGTLDMARLPFRVQCGTVTLTGVSWASVSISGFSNTPMIFVSFTDNASSTDLRPLKTQQRSATGFQVCMAGSSASGSRVVCWLAIGT